MKSQTNWRGLFNIWVLGGAFLFGLLLFAITFVLLQVTRTASNQVAQASAIVNVIPAPTSTPTQQPTETAPEPTPTRLVPPAPAPGVISVEDYVQITNTEGDGLRLRTDAGLQSQVRLLGAESEVFQVKDGPREADGFTWWYLVGLYDASRSGWAVSNYLAVVQKP